MADRGDEEEWTSFLWKYLGLQVKKLGLESPCFWTLRISWKLWTDSSEKYIYTWYFAWVSWCSWVPFRQVKYIVCLKLHSPLISSTIVAGELKILSFSDFFVVGVACDLDLIIVIQVSVTVGASGNIFLKGSSLAATLHQFFALCIFALLSASQECRQNSWRNSSYHTFVMIKAMEQRQLSKKTEGTGDVLDSSATTGWFTLGPLIKWDSTLSCLIHWSRIFCYSESSPNWWYWLINISTCYVPVQFKHFIY